MQISLFLPGDKPVFTYRLSRYFRWLTYSSLDSKIQPHVWNIPPFTFFSISRVFSFRSWHFRFAWSTCFLWKLVQWSSIWIPHSVLLSTRFSQLSGSLFIFTGLLLRHTPLTMAKPAEAVEYTDSISVEG